MTRHTLLLRFGLGVPQPARDSGLQLLIALCDRVGEVTSFACGPDVDSRVHAQGFTHAFAITFGSEEARDMFRSLPDYDAVLERLSQIAEFTPVTDEMIGSAG